VYRRRSRHVSSCRRSCSNMVNQSFSPKTLFRSNQVHFNSDHFFDLSRSSQRTRSSTSQEICFRISLTFGPFAFLTSFSTLAGHPKGSTSRVLANFCSYHNFWSPARNDSQKASNFSPHHCLHLSKAPTIPNHQGCTRVNILAGLYTENMLMLEF